MSKKVLFSRREIHEDENGDKIILSTVDIDEVAEKIVNDIKTVKIDTSNKVYRIKDRIANILHLYRREYVDEACSTTSEADMEEMRRNTMRELRKSVTGLYKKAKIDTNVIQLYDQAMTEEAKHGIRKTVIDENLSFFKDKTKEEAQRINDRTKTLTSATKLAIENYLQENASSTTNSSSNTGKSYTGNKVDFAECDAQTKKLVEKTKHKIRENVHVFLTNPTGKKTQEEIESEKLLLENLVQFETKVKGDLQSQKEVVDRTVNNIKCKIGNLLPLPQKNEDE